MPAPAPGVSLQYPIGPPGPPPVSEGREAHLCAIADHPRLFAEAFSALSQDQLDTPYREGGWTLRQVAHHVADSHLNAFVRLKLALTEDWPIIKAYDEKLWAATAETQGPIEPALALLVPLHARMTTLLRSLPEDAWQRGYTHPERGRVTLAKHLGLYSWHGRHHTAHVTALRQRMGW